MAVRGKFIVVEGVDFTGKTTQVKKISDFLSKHNIDNIITREPGGTKVGEVMRDLILKTESDELSKEAILLLFMSSRAENIAKIIEPALKEGKWVICDRFLASTIVYQGVLSGFKTEDILNAHKNFNYNLYPDLTILLDANTDVLMERKKVQNLERQNNKFDFLPKQTFDSLRDAFLKTANIATLNTKIINTELSQDEVFEEIKKLLLHYML
jgi:dTMP kinase